MTKLCFKITVVAVWIIASGQEREEWGKVEAWRKQLK